MSNRPKIELHCHLDGSIRPKIIQTLLQDKGEGQAIQDLQKQLEAPRDCSSLAEYLTCFDLPIRCLQTKKGLYEAAYDLIRQAAEDYVKYIEVRFAPVFSTQEGLSIVEVIEAVKNGLMNAGEAYGVESGILVCGMRHLSPESNIQMLKEAMELYGAGVVGCDLAGDEKAFPTHLFEEFFKKARAYEIPFTIHSGECGSLENVQCAINYGAKRLGHGIALKQSPEWMQICAKKRIGVELCPTSNLQTKAVGSMEDYPYALFRENGIMISINTDNRIVSATTMNQEFDFIQNYYGLTDEDWNRIYKDSIEMSFASEEQKHNLWKEIG